MAQYSFNPDDPKERSNVRIILDALDSLGFPANGNSQSCPAQQIYTNAEELEQGQCPSQKGVSESFANDEEKKIADFEKEKKEMKTQINDLERRLSRYKSYPIADAEGEEFYFNINGECLIETHDYTAPYKAIRSLDGYALFSFNVEKGLMKASCKNKDTQLVPFCDIEDEQEEATEIKMVQAGKGAFSDGESQLTVIEKAKVRLIKI